MKAACETCGWIHADCTRRVGIFTNRGEIPTYRATYEDAPIRFDRAEAEADWCAWKVRSA